ncbi:O-antigen ligase family protein [Microbacterium halophytorum]|uniref:O-antigen ligase family protein n=1 Tax=Microbacterium halophytorum TaxID=2067568 RepID=UPI000CFAB497|nr:O-antigen ligase family protein [Microbacterium halophytorum]
MIRPLREQFVGLLGSADFARVYTIASLGTALGGFAIRYLASAWTLYAMIGGLTVIGAGMLWVRRRELTLIGFAPTMLLGFVVWALVSIAWAFDHWESFASWVELSAYTFIAVAIAQVRDTAQIVRALGDVLRALLLASIGVEVVVGILLDTEFGQLAIAGNIAYGGPIQGVFGTRNLLAFAAMIALVTFYVEWRLKAVSGGTALGSVILAGVVATLTNSPTAVVLAVALAATLAALLLVKRVRPERRLDVHRGLGVGVVALVAAAYLFRGPLFEAIDRATAFSNRADLWSEVLRWVQRRPIQGWGWYGDWREEPFPFRTINFLTGSTHSSALNAYLDVTLQLGAVGLILFVGMSALALARGWVLAVERRSPVFLWTPLMLVALLVTSLAESFTLAGPAWLLFVLCIVTAGKARSWRTLVLDRPDLPEPLPPDDRT